MQTSLANNRSHILYYDIYINYVKHCVPEKTVNKPKGKELFCENRSRTSRTASNPIYCSFRSISYVCPNLKIAPDITDS